MAAAKCLYEVLGLEKSASQSEIKKAYYKLALKLHPDKCGQHDEETNAKFQTLQKVYGILGDPEKRKVYDETGATDDDELSGGKFDDLVDYFRAMFKVTEDDIDDFQVNYQGSAEERTDLLQYYRQFKGDMGEVFRWLMCSVEEQDSHRLMDVLEEAIAKGEIQSTKAYARWAKAVATRPRPAPRKLAKDKKQGAGGGSSNALVAAIQAKRGAAADALLDALAAKYGGGGAKKAKKGGQEGAVVAASIKRSKKAAPEPEEISEEAFAAARARLEARAAGAEAGRGKKRSKPDDTEGKEEEEEEGQPAGSRRKGKGGKKQQVVVEDEEEDIGSSGGGSEEEEEQQDAATGRAGGKKKGKAAPAASGRSRKDKENVQTGSSPKAKGRGKAALKGGDPAPKQPASKRAKA